MNLSRNRYLLLVDVVLLAIAPFLLFTLRFEGFHWPPHQLHNAIIFTLVMVPARIVVYYLFGVYRTMWRYASIAELELVIIAGRLGVGSRRPPGREHSAGSRAHHLPNSALGALQRRRAERRSPRRPPVPDPHGRLAHGSPGAGGLASPRAHCRRRRRRPDGAQGTDLEPAPRHAGRRIRGRRPIEAWPSDRQGSGVRDARHDPGHHQTGRDHRSGDRHAECPGVGGARRGPDGAEVPASRRARSPRWARSSAGT